jgi:hypothetical protein
MITTKRTPSDHKVHEHYDSWSDGTRSEWVRASTGVYEWERDKQRWAGRQRFFFNSSSIADACVVVLERLSAGSRLQSVPWDFAFLLSCTRAVAAGCPGIVHLRIAPPCSNTKRASNDQFSNFFHDAPKLYTCTRVYRCSIYMRVRTCVMRVRS